MKKNFNKNILNILKENSEFTFVWSKITKADGVNYQYKYKCIIEGEDYYFKITINNNIFFSIKNKNQTIYDAIINTFVFMESEELYLSFKTIAYNHCTDELETSGFSLDKKLREKQISSMKAFIDDIDDIKVKHALFHINGI